MLVVNWLQCAMLGWMKSTWNNVGVNTTVSSECRVEEWNDRPASRSRRSVHLLVLYVNTWLSLELKEIMLNIRLQDRLAWMGVVSEKTSDVQNQQNAGV